MAPQTLRASAQSFTVIMCEELEKSKTDARLARHNETARGSTANKKIINEHTWHLYLLHLVMSLLLPVNQY